MKKLTSLGLLLLCSAFAYTQETMVLDNAILDSVDFFSSRLQSRAIVAVTNFEAETKELSDFIIQELMVGFSNSGNVRVVERSRLEMLQTELNFNMSSSVSDETAQDIGRMLGAQILISGSIIPYREMYRMRVQAIVVETTEIIGTRTINIKYDPALVGLLGRINPADAWKYQWLYVGVSAGYGPVINAPESFLDNLADTENIPFAFSLYAMFQPFDLFGIALDLHGNLSAQSISIIPTLVLRPASFEINVFAGVGFNGAGLNINGGVRGGYHLGPGVLFAEIRPVAMEWFWDYSRETPTGFESRTEFGWILSMNFTLGYKIGFFQRKK